MARPKKLAQNAVSWGLGDLQGGTSLCESAMWSFSTGVCLKSSSKPAHYCKTEVANQGGRCVWNLIKRELSGKENSNRITKPLTISADQQANTFQTIEAGLLLVCLQYLSLLYLDQ